MVGFCHSLIFFLWLQRMLTCLWSNSEWIDWAAIFHLGGEGIQSFWVSTKKNSIRKWVIPALLHKQPVGSHSGADSALSGAFCAMAAVVFSSCSALCVCVCSHSSAGGRQHRGGQEWGLVLRRADPALRGGQRGERRGAAAWVPPELPQQLLLPPGIRLLSLLCSPAPFVVLYLCSKVLLFSGLVWGVF